jgi:hypothetical protein
LYVSSSLASQARIEFCKNALAVRSPAVRFGIEIVMIQKAENVGDQGCDAAKSAWADDLAGDFTKEAFHRSTRLSQEEEVGMKWM